MKNTILKFIMLLGIAAASTACTKKEEVQPVVEIPRVSEFDIPLTFTYKPSTFYIPNIRVDGIYSCEIWSDKLLDVGIHDVVTFYIVNSEGLFVYYYPYGQPTYEMSYDNQSVKYTLEKTYQHTIGALPVNKVFGLTVKMEFFDSTIPFPKSDIILNIHVKIIKA